MRENWLHADGGAKLDGMEALALTGGLLVELRPRRVRRADLLIVRGDISVVGEAPRGVRTIDCAGAIVMPGLVDAHTHLARSLARGMPRPGQPPSNLVEWLERVWWRYDRALDEEAIEVAALVGAVEAVRAGVTTLFDLHASSCVAGSLDRVAAAVEQVGVRGVIAWEVSDHRGERAVRAALAESDRLLASLARAPRPLVRGMVGAHAGFTLKHATTVALADLAVRHDVGVHLHVAEDPVDARHLVPAREASVVEWLDQYRLLSSRALLAMCVHVDDEGAAAVAASGATVAHCARANQDRAAGYARPARFEGHAALGSDGVDGDLLAEARAAYLAARSHGQAFDPLAALARGQSLAAGAFDTGLGRLEPGCPADLVVRALDPATPLDAANLDAHLLAGAAAVRDVFVGGREVVRGGRVVTIDEEALAARARELAARLWRRLA